MKVPMSRRLGFSLLAILAGIAGLALTNVREGPESLEGRPAPNVQLKTLDNKDFNLSELKGNVVLMDYWATWCPPCRKSLPHLNELANDKELFNRGLRVVGINSREDESKVSQFMKKNDYTFITPMDLEGKFGEDYMVEGIPTTVLVDQSGTIKKVWVGYDDSLPQEMKTEIEKLLGDAK